MAIQTPKIVTIETKKDERFLRERTRAFDFSSAPMAEIRELIMNMKNAMHTANGIGLSANQIGLPFRVFVAEVPAPGGKVKFYAVFNPSLEVTSKETVTHEEGCLSIPGVYGGVARVERVVLRGSDKHGKPLKIKAWGLLARVFQHEIDHLDGKLFIDTAERIHRVSATEGSIQ